mgnify:CR=1 FL=1
MEYQQFINFLKAKHCHNEFLEILPIYQSYFFKRHKYSIKEVFDMTPSNIISNCIDWRLLNSNDKEKYEFWVVIHYKWYDYFYKYRKNNRLWNTNNL